MSGLKPRNAFFALAVATLVASPAMAQGDRAADAKTASEAAKQERSEAADARAYAVPTAATQARPSAARNNSPTAREIWRQRHHLPNAR